MDATSFLSGVVAGGFVLGLIGFMAGAAIGSLCGKIDSAKKLLKEMIGDPSSRLEHGEMYTVQLCMGKEWMDDDDGGGEGEELEPQLDGRVRFN